MATCVPSRSERPINYYKVWNEVPNWVMDDIISHNARFGICDDPGKNLKVVCTYTSFSSLFEYEFEVASMKWSPPHEADNDVDVNTRQQQLIELLGLYRPGEAPLRLFKQLSVIISWWSWRNEWELGLHATQTSFNCSGGSACLYSTLPRTQGLNRYEIVNI